MEAILSDTAPSQLNCSITPSAGCGTGVLQYRQRPHSSHKDQYQHLLPPHEQQCAVLHPVPPDVPCAIWTRAAGSADDVTSASSAALLSHHLCFGSALWIEEFQWLISVSRLCCSRHLLRQHQHDHKPGRAAERRVRIRRLPVHAVRHQQARQRQLVRNGYQMCSIFAEQVLTSGTVWHLIEP